MQKRAVPPIPVAPSLRSPPKGKERLPVYGSVLATRKPMQLRVRNIGTPFLSLSSLTLAAEREI